MIATDFLQAAALIIHYLLGGLALSIGLLASATFLYQLFVEWRRRHPHQISKEH